MLTGDSPLTACHVAKELKISPNKQLVLSCVDPASNQWEWQKVGGDSTFPLAQWDQLRKQYDLCLTGEVSSLATIHHVCVCAFLVAGFVPPDQCRWREALL